MCRVRVAQCVYRAQSGSVSRTSIEQAPIFLYLGVWHHRCPVCQVCEVCLGVFDVLCVSCVRVLCVSVRVQACVFVLECGCECLCVISELCVCGGVRVV